MRRAQALQLLNAAAHRRVRTVASEYSPTADALFEVATGGRKDWTKPEWSARLVELDTCDDRVGDWLLCQ